MGSADFGCNTAPAAGSDYSTDSAGLGRNTAPAAGPDYSIGSAGLNRNTVPVAGPDYSIDSAGLDRNTAPAADPDYSTAFAAVRQFLRSKIHIPPFVAAVYRSAVMLPGLPMCRYKPRLPLIFFRTWYKILPYAFPPCFFFAKFFFFLPYIY